MLFKKKDRVIVTEGGLKGRKGKIKDVEGDTCLVDLDGGIAGIVGFSAEQLTLDDEEMVKVYGGAFGTIVGLKK